MLCFEELHSPSPGVFDLIWEALFLVLETVRDSCVGWKQLVYEESVFPVVGLWSAPYSKCSQKLMESHMLQRGSNTPLCKYILLISRAGSMHFHNVRFVMIVLHRGEGIYHAPTPAALQHTQVCRSSQAYDARINNALQEMFFWGPSHSSQYAAATLIENPSHPPVNGWRQILIVAHCWDGS